MAELWGRFRKGGRPAYSSVVRLDVVLLGYLCSAGSCIGYENVPYEVGMHS